MKSVDQSKDMMTEDSGYDSGVSALRYGRRNVKFDFNHVKVSVSPKCMWRETDGEEMQFPRRMLMENYMACKLSQVTENWRTTES